jgi:hypothetical protein
MPASGLAAEAIEASLALIHRFGPPDSVPHLLALLTR